MARPQSTEKMGTFPLDKWRAEQLTKVVKNTHPGMGRILDPFCDTGEAVKLLADAWGFEAYGVEIKEEAARKAQELLGPDKAIYGDCYNDVVISNGAFDVLYLNPPYDVDYSETESNRAEYKALRNHWKYLRNGGMVIWVAYQHHISKTVARYLFEHCKFVFPFYWKAPHLDTYTQICLIGLKKDNPKDEPLSAREMVGGAEHLRRVGAKNDEKHIKINKSMFFELSKEFRVKHPYMSDIRKVRNKKTGEIKNLVDSRIIVDGTLYNKLIFRRKEQDIELIKQMNQTHGMHLLPEFNDIFRLSVIDDQDDTPIAKPRTGQLGLVVASGMMNNITLTHKDKRCMVRGSVKHKDVTASIEEEKDSNGNIRTVTTEHTIPSPSVIIMYEDGTIENLTEEDSLSEFIEQHMEQLIQIYTERYEPAFDMYIHPLWGSTFDSNPVRGEYEYLTTQELVAVSMAEHLMRNKIGGIVGEMGFGKSSRNDSRVYTPDGYKLMEEILVGDKVIGINGEPVDVIGVFPQGKIMSYKVTFTDNSFTHVSKDHLWEIQTPLNKWKGKPAKIMSTYEIMKKGLTHANGNLQNFIPLVNPVNFNKRDHIISPYIMGALIGDGGLSCVSVMFTNNDKNVIDRFDQELPNNHRLNRKSNYDYRVVNDGAERQNSVTDELRRLNLMGCNSFGKFIPDEYLYDSIENRISLLQGLMDTDGTIGSVLKQKGNRKGGKNSCPTYTTVSKRLADNVVELVQSLGGTAKYSERITTYTHKGVRKNGSVSYRITMSIPYPIDPFYCKRKAERYAPAKSYVPTRAITSIEEAGIYDHTCIAVDHYRHLYATDGFIMTHNTPVASIISKMMYKFEEEKLGGYDEKK